MEIAAFVVSVIALGFSGWALWYKRRETHAAEDAAREAQRAADAAQEAVSYQRDEIERSRVRWELEPLGHGEGLLHNHGTHPAYGVRIEPGEGLGIDGNLSIDEFPDGHAEPYIFMPSASSDNKIVVTWHNEPDRSDQVLRRALAIPMRVEH